MRRIQPLQRSVDLASRRATIDLRTRVRDAERHVFTLDLYSHLDERHPETHAGWWALRLPEGDAQVRVGLDLTTIGPHSVWLERVEPAGGLGAEEAEVGRRSPHAARAGFTPAREPAVDCWSNPDYRFAPLIGIQCVLRSPEGKVLENRFVTGKVNDPAVMAGYYKKVHAEGGYTPTEPFLFELHAEMLRRLEPLFLRHVPSGGVVLDAGCGRSLFTEIRPDWPFRIVASDVDLDLLKARRDAFPQVRWAVGSAHPLPFRDGAFDALFAGELIEHLGDPAPAVADFHRVLKPGGTLILTTPNRLRLANLVDRSDRPYSPDHLSELSYDEVAALLRAGGFEIETATGLHLELFLNWFSPLPKLDWLQRYWNRPWAVPLMRLMLKAGALAPRYAVDLVFVCRRLAP
jgi:SAM-dependent methyltransferase